MSYVLFGADSDVYVFLHEGGWFSCSVAGDVSDGGACVRCDTAAEVLSWLDARREAGLKVPDMAYKRFGGEE